MLAIALVIVAPLISRALAPSHAPAISPPHAVENPSADADAHAHAAHSAMGDDDVHAVQHAHHDMAHDDGKGSADVPVDPHANHDMGVDCEYCLIAGRLITLLVALLLLLTQWPAVFRSLAGLVGRRHSPAQGTLGARGPPVLVC